MKPKLIKKIERSTFKFGKIQLKVEDGQLKSMDGQTNLLFPDHNGEEVVLVSVDVFKRMQNQIWEQYYLIQAC